MRQLLGLFVVGLALFSGALGAPAARADGFVIVIPPEPLPPRPAWFPLAVKWHRVTVTIEDQVATTEVEQVFSNPNPADLEGTYLFPLPAGASVSKFSLFLGGKEVEAEVLDRDRAREIYESIVRKMRDPGLLEYVGEGAVKARIYPIPARGEARVRLAYEQVLAADGGLCEYRYPLATEKWSAQPLEQASIAVTIRAKAPIASVFSPTHPLDLARGAEGREARAAWEAKGVLPDRDFVLYFQKARPKEPITVTALSHRPPGDDGYFLLLVAPGEELAGSEPMPKDVVFVVDTSGSMAGEKMDQAKAALRYCLRSLDARDRFAIIDFSTEVRGFGDGLVAAEKDVLARAEAYVDAMKARGGTDIHDALIRALSLAGRPGAPYYVCFLTDGEPTIGVTEPGDIEKAVGAARARRPDAEDVRLFCFGLVGERNELDTGLLDRLAEANRGTREYVGPRESVEVKVSRFFDKISSPVLAGVALEIPGAEAYDLYPRPLPDLFRGGEVAIVGRYRAGGPRAIRVRGKVAGKPLEVVAETRLADEAAAPFLPRVFAVRKVAFLLDQIRLHGESAELRREVVRLAKEHAIVTPYTSYLIAEDARVSMGPGGSPEPAARAIEELGRAKAAGARAAGVAASEAARKLAETPALGPAPTPAETALGALDAAGRFRQGGATGPDRGGLEHAVRDLIRTVDGRTFYFLDGVWTDARVRPSAEVTRVVYLSESYFALLRERPVLGKFLALGPRVRVEAEGKTVEVVAEE
jgi:Ca-activated chloride channel family protein